MSAKTTKSTRWWIRIDGPHEFLKSKYLAVCGWPDHVSSGIAYHLGEKKDNPHCHIALTTSSDIQKQSLAVRIKSLFDIKTKGAYMVEPWDGQLKVFSYMYHDGESEENVDVTRAKLSPDDIAHISTLRSVYKEIVTSANEKAKHKCITGTLEAIQFSGSIWTPKDIMRFILSGVRENKWYNPGPCLFRYVDEIYLKQGSAEEGEECLEKLVNKYYNQYDRDGWTR